MHNFNRHFEYVHSYLWDPERVKTHGGGFYFISIIDDFSQRVWIYILKSKSNAFKKFNEWYTLIVNQLETKQNLLRIDNGFKFAS